MSLAIVGLGTSVPAATLSQDEAMRVARALCCRTLEHASWLPTMYGGTGIDNRYISLGRDLVRDLLDGTTHSGSVFLPKENIPDDRGPTTAQRMVLYAEGAGPLAFASSRQALANAKLQPQEITHLVTVSCTGFYAPGVDHVLIDGLPLKPTVQRTHVGFMGCHGAINGLRVAAAFVGADPKAKVLLCAVEMSCLHYHFGWDPQKIVANALFGDGAAAVVGVAGAKQPWRVTATGSCVLPDSAKAMSWTIGDHGFEMTLSKQVPALIAKHLRPWMQNWLAESGLKIEDVKSWALHPGGPRVLSAVEETLELTPASTAVSREIFGTCGNMSSPTVLFILDKLRARNQPRPAVALAFGPGLVAEAALIV